MATAKGLRISEMDAVMPRPTCGLGVPVQKKSSFFTEVEEKTLPENTVNGVQGKIRENNEYEFIQTDVRNVLLCGRSRSGKTTTVGVLKDPCYHPKTNSIFADSAGTRFQTFSINNRADSKVEKFTINIIDTPGLFEVRAKDQEARDDEVICETIAKCLENEITYMNVIILFASFEAGINPHDILAMQKFLALFGESNVKIALCITRADAHNRAWRDELVAQLNQQADLSRMIEKEKMEIMFMGCVEPGNSRYDTEDKLLQGYVNVYNMRSKLLDFIFEASTRSQIKRMKVTTTKLSDMKLKLQTAIANLQYFNSVRDYDVSQYQQRVVEHHKLMEFINQNQTYVNFSDLSDVSELTNMAKIVKANAAIPAADKVKMLFGLAD
eukprot:TRINITY_DN986_c0_g1_i1.p1 TRINITY_DN986_c0_g1~~TRINITY_DN986_c0_g1_i1.p1  ORF type:complete len:383 (+),score=104.20 TRINITY_DN986_c0_g1_i1:56-1204(+)